MSISNPPPPSVTDWQDSLVQQALFIYGAGFAVGLYLASLHLYATNSWALFFIYLLGAMLFSTAAIFLWRYVFPRFSVVGGVRYIAIQVAICFLTFGFISFVAVEIDGYARTGLSMWSPYQGPDKTIVIPAEALRWAPLIYSLMPIVPTALLCVVGYNLHWWRINTLKSRERELRAMAASAQLTALRAQINPHFLFNSLNSIAQLISTDPTKAEECVERLAEIYRYLLKRSQHEFVALADELEVAHAYLMIEKARFGDDLKIRQEIEESARGTLLPGLILQPLVENAVRHGVSQKIGGGEVHIKASFDNGDLCLSVADTGIGMKERETVFERGIGLRNVRDRLTRLYGPTYEPHIETENGSGTTVTVRVPVRYSEAA